MQAVDFVQGSLALLPSRRLLPSSFFAKASCDRIAEMNERHDAPSPRLPSPVNYDVTRRARHEDIASMVPARLEELPRLRGFRLRGLEMTRLETFIDAAFAFAISMLVI